jgi:hypothetical protein
MKLLIERSDGEQTELLTWESAAENSGTVSALVDIFVHCIQLQQRKHRTYGDAFRSQGYMGNVARVLSKVSRLKTMVWRDQWVNDSEETVEDTMQDLINLAAFFLINYRDRNKWGND